MAGVGRAEISTTLEESLERGTRIPWVTFPDIEEPTNSPEGSKKPKEGQASLRAKRRVGNTGNRTHTGGGGYSDRYNRVGDCDGGCSSRDDATAAAYGDPAPVGEPRESYGGRNDDDRFSCRASSPGSLHVSLTNHRFICTYQSCTKTFRRYGDLTRHFKKHFICQRVFHCFHAGCYRNGDHGFYRKDKFFDHRRKKHGF